MFDQGYFYKKNNKKYSIKFCHSTGHIPWNPFMPLNDNFVKDHGGEITTLYFKNETEKRAFELGIMFRNCFETIHTMDEKAV